MADCIEKEVTCLAKRKLSANITTDWRDYKQMQPTFNLPHQPLGS
ncbi:protein of unknown function [Vibrio tapetis subsp. tapetis]|uniref:Uncharacterized protein n=1 Tax=Vibrio tapetis subsp. tapetis TaxID=1671868 RepID=A0A2N8Z8G1_9VIBR|nr:protein of unknown function [Vibrio tapetis subsp. tapetis]